uniref:Uncharacterized protein n=1 Tax=Rhizophora mucronata TaxID=61149 RepID=A0A2P2N379_RHIMU
MFLALVMVYFWFLLQTLLFIAFWLSLRTCGMLKSQLAFLLFASGEVEFPEFRFFFFFGINVWLFPCREM